MNPSTLPPLAVDRRPVWTVRHVRQAPLRFLQTLADRGDVVPFAIGRQRAVLLCHPNDIGRVLRSNDGGFVKGPALDRARQLLGTGLLTAEGDLHARRRQAIQPAFHRAHLDRYGETMVRFAARLSGEWRDGGAVDLGREMQTLTLAIVSEALFGAELDERQSADVRETLAEAIASQDPLVSLLAPIRRMRPAGRRLHAVVDGLIERRLRSGEAREDLLGVLLLAHDPAHDPSRQQLHDDFLTLLLAGHDTIANALTWTWILLAQHRGVEEELHRELDRVLGARLPAPGDVAQLKYTRAVFAEALRLFPPAWVLARQAVGDYELETATIPAGSLVIMSQYLAHRDARFFPDPLAFDPSRWLSERTPEGQKLAYFPFGAGPRSCIGEGFAWMEGVLILAVLARHWRVEPLSPDAIEIETRITLRPKPPVLGHVHSRS